MTKTLTICDRCRVEITAGRTRLVVEGGGPSPAWPPDPASGRPTLDLCSGCSAALSGWLAGKGDDRP